MIELEMLDEQEKNIMDEINYKRLTAYGIKILHQQLTSILKKKEIIYKQQIEELKYGTNSSKTN